MGDRAPGCRLRVEVGEVTDYIYYPDGRIARSGDTLQTNRMIRQWQPTSLTRWQRAIVWMMGHGPVTLVQARNDRRFDIPPRWFFGDR